MSVTELFPDTRLEKIEADIAEIKETLDFIRETMVKADRGIAAIGEQVMPTIEELKKSPFLKMLGVGK